MSQDNNQTYGGQAVIEGVMIRGKTSVSVAVRNPYGNIETRTKSISPIFSGQLRKTPFIRGILALAETLYIGMDALNYSSSVANKTEHANEINPSNRVTMSLMLVLSISISIGLFFLTPLFISKPFEGVLGSNIASNIIEGFVRLGIFMIYIVGIGFMSDIKRVYMYHGAEHMTVHAQENKMPLDISHIKKYPTAHPRCGTAFLLTVMLVAIFIFMFIPRDPLWFVIVSRIILVPIIASISYELIRINGKYPNNLIIRLTSQPSLWLQGLTTKQPTEDQIEVAIAAMNAAIKSDIT
jgi:uncharacterized protein YqhQ